MEPYVTVEGYVSQEFVEKKSRFIGHIAPVTSEHEAVSFLGYIRSRHPDAAHNVFAWRLRNGLARMSDDGEPRGTGGQAVFGVIERMRLENVAVAVTRYFGGILLGTGGLTRAYSRAAKLAADKAKLVKMRPCRVISLDISYDMYGQILRELSDFSHRLLNTFFDDSVHLKVLLPLEDCDSFNKDVNDLTSGRVGITVLDETWDHVD